MTDEMLKCIDCQEWVPRAKMLDHFWEKHDDVHQEAGAKYRLIVKDGVLSIEKVR